MAVIGITEIPAWLPTAAMVNDDNPQVRADQVANLGQVLEAVAGVLEQLTQSGVVIELGTGIVTELAYNQTATAGGSIFAARDDHTHGSPGLSSAAGLDVASAGAAGVGTEPPKHDHVHRGVFTVKKFGAADIFGTITLTGTGVVTLAQVGNNVAIDVPAPTYPDPQYLMSLHRVNALLTGTVGLSTTWADATDYMVVPDNLSVNVKFSAKLSIVLVAARTVEWRIITQAAAVLLSGSSALGAGGSTLDICDVSATANMPVTCPESAKLQARITVASAGSNFGMLSHPAWVLK